MGNTVEQGDRALHRGFKPFLKSINIGGNRFFNLVDAQHLELNKLFNVSVLPDWQ
jgi:hypothetical protein